MAKDQTKRLNPKLLASDETAVNAIEEMSDYSPSNTDFTREKIAVARSIMDTKHKLETQAKDAYDAARDAAAKAEWAFHNIRIGASDQVVAQYGRDSDQGASVGRKKSSERKSPTRKPKPSA